MKLTGPLLGAVLLTLAVGWLGAAIPALAPARGDDDPARPRNGYPVAYAIKDAKLLTVSQGTIARGSILVENGKITAVGTGVKAKPGMAVIEAAGLVAMPGIIDTHSHIAIQGGVNEFSLSIVPEVRVKDVVTGDDVSIYRALANGVLTAYVQPTGGLISGQGCVINLRGWVPRELVVVDPAALDVTIPTFVPRTPEGPRRGPGPGPGSGPGGAEGGSDPQARRKDQLEAIREHFRRALRYGEVVAQARSKGVAPPPFDPRLSALVPYAKGQQPVVFLDKARTEILDALAIAKELKLKAVISGGSEAWKVAGALKEAGVPVLVGGTLNVPSHDHDPYDAAYANP